MSTHTERLSRFGLLTIPLTWRPKHERSTSLGARTRAGDPKQIAEVREAAAKTVSIGAQPTRPRSRRRGSARPATSAAISKAVTPERCRGVSCRKWDTGRCRHCRQSALTASTVVAARRVRSPSAWRCGARVGRFGWEAILGGRRAPTSNDKPCGIAVAVSPRQTEVCAPAGKTMGRLPPYPRRKLSKICRHSSLSENPAA